MTSDETPTEHCCVCQDVEPDPAQLEVCDGCGGLFHVDICGDESLCWDCFT